MGLNDEKEKLKQAEKWLTEAEVASEHFMAASEHVQFIRWHSDDEEVVAIASRLRDVAVGRILSQPAKPDHYPDPPCGVVPVTNKEEKSGW